MHGQYTVLHVVGEIERQLKEEDTRLVVTDIKGKPIRDMGRDPFNQNSNRSDREKRTTSKGGPVFPKLFRLDRPHPLSFGPKFPEILVEWIAPMASTRGEIFVFRFHQLDCK